MSALDQVFGTVEPPIVTPPHDWKPRRSHAGTTESLRADSTAVPADDPPAPRFTLLSPADVLSRPRLPWAVSRVVPLSGLMSIYGPSGSGKSFLTLDLVAALAEGRDWFGHKIKKDRSVVYVALEGAEGILDAHLLISNDARQFLADLAAGKVQRSKGRPLARSAADERRLTGLVYAEWDRLLAAGKGGARDGSPRDKAIEAVASQHRVSPDQLRGIVNKVRDAGMDRAFWAKRGAQPFTG